MPSSVLLSWLSSPAKWYLKASSKLSRTCSNNKMLLKGYYVVSRHSQKLS